MTLNKKKYVLFYRKLRDRFYTKFPHTTTKYGVTSPEIWDKLYSEEFRNTKFVANDLFKLDSPRSFYRLYEKAKDTKYAGLTIDIDTVSLVKAMDFLEIQFPTNFDFENFESQRPDKETEAIIREVFERSLMSFEKVIISEEELNKIRNEIREEIREEFRKEQSTNEKIANANHRQFTNGASQIISDFFRYIDTKKLLDAWNCFTPAWQDYGFWKTFDIFKDDFHSYRKKVSVPAEPRIFELTRVLNNSQLLIVYYDEIVEYLPPIEEEKVLAFLRDNAGQYEITDAQVRLLAMRQEYKHLVPFGIEKWREFAPVEVLESATRLHTFECRLIDDKWLINFIREGKEYTKDFDFFKSRSIPNEYAILFNRL